MVFSWHLDGLAARVAALNTEVRYGMGECHVKRCKNTNLLPVSSWIQQTGLMQNERLLDAKNP